MALHLSFPAQLHNLNHQINFQFQILLATFQGSLQFNDARSTFPNPHPHTREPQPSAELESTKSTKHNKLMEHDNSIQSDQSLQRIRSRKPDQSVQYN